jgi:hypothetical protein
LIEILKDQAISETGGSDTEVKSFFINLIDEANIPKEWKQQIKGGFRGVSKDDARFLIQWAGAQGINRKDKRYTTLGSLLKPLLPTLGRVEEVAKLIIKYRLYLKDELLDELGKKYLRT